MEWLSLKWKLVLVLTGLNQLRAAFVRDFDEIHLLSKDRDTLPNKADYEYGIYLNVSK